MPLPCPQVFHNIFKEYDFLRMENRKSIFNYIKSTAEGIIGKSVVDQIEVIKNDILTDIEIVEPPKDTQTQCEAFFNLIFKLGEKAHIAQDLKDKYPKLFSKEDQSLFCETLHCLRSYIIEQLSGTNDWCREFYNKKVKDLKDKVSELEAKLDHVVVNENGSGAKAITEELTQDILKLAFLEEKVFIVKARLYKELSYLKIYDKKYLLLDKKVPSQDLNEAIPLCLHKRFDQILYELEFRTHTKSSYPEFLRTASLEYSNKQAEKKTALLQEGSELNKLTLEKDNDAFFVIENHNTALTNNYSQDGSDQSVILSEMMQNKTEAKTRNKMRLFDEANSKDPILKKEPDHEDVKLTS